MTSFRVPFSLGALSTAVLVGSLMLAPASLAAENETSPAPTGPDPREVLEASIAAHGGESGLADPPTLVEKGTRTTFTRSAELPGTWAAWYGGPDRVRYELRRERKGSTSEFIMVLDGEECWMMYGRRPYDCPPGNIKTQLAHRPSLLLRARGPEVELSALLPKKVGDRDAVGIEAKLDDGPVRLYFDAETHHLVEMEYKSMDSDGQGGEEEKVHKFLFGDWRESGGRSVAHRIVEFEDGIRREERIVVEHRPGEEISGTKFARPEDDDPRIYFEEFIY